jgi:NADH-quinone oxidoreductase subunit N
MLLGIICSFLLINAQDLIFLGLSLTGLNIVVYVLIAITKTQRSVEAAIKYFIMGILATYLYLFGAFAL